MKATRMKSLGVTLIMAAGLWVAGCGDDGGSKPTTDTYLAQTTPDNVLEDFQRTWNNRDIEEYAALLAADFQFYFDVRTRTERGLPTYWTRLQDSTAVARLFSSDKVEDITLALTWPRNSWTPDASPGRQRWVYIDVLDVFLDVDLAPTDENPDGVTFRVQDQRQRFYFRKGRTEADTLSTSATADLYYIVEWRDYGVEASPGGLAPAVGESVTWSGIKTIYN